MNLRRSGEGVQALIFALLIPSALLAVNLSPRLESNVESLLGFDGDSVRVPAHLISCRAQRDGQEREDVIRCKFDFVVNGMRRESEGNVWSSESPFLTPELEIQAWGLLLIVAPFLLRWIVRYSVSATSG